MSDCQNGRISELLRNHSLDRLLRHHVDVGSGLVQHHKLASAEDRSDDAEELALADRQILTLLLDLELEAILKVEASFAEKVCDPFIRMLIEWVNIEPE